MEVTQIFLIVAVIVILLLMFLLLLPRLRKLLSKPSDDYLDIQFKVHPFDFKRNPDNPLNDKIVEAVSRMGGAGDNAEEEYQASLETLRSVAEEAVSIIVEEYKDLPEKQYLDRWSLIQLLVEMKHPSSLQSLDEILSTSIPPEQSKDPHTFSTRGEEVIIRTTAIEAIVQIATEDNREAVDLLLKHTRHENFSVKRAAIQGYLSLDVKNGREVLLNTLPKNDHYILDIRRVDVHEIPQPRAEEVPGRPEIDDLPRTHPPKPPRDSGTYHLM
jgi:hypothetical protein